MEKSKGLPMQEDHPNSPRVAQQALVLGSTGCVRPDPTVAAQPAHSEIQSDSTQESGKSNLYAWNLQPPLLKSMASLKQ